jgi:hypothetical protein
MGVENIGLMDFDVSPLLGRTVEVAQLFVKPTGEHGLKTLGLSTVSSPWQEGRGDGGDAQPGEACFLEAARGERPWA